MQIRLTPGHNHRLNFVHPILTLINLVNMPTYAGISILRIGHLTQQRKRRLEVRHLIREEVQHITEGGIERAFKPGLILTAGLIFRGFRHRPESLSPS